MKKSKKSKKSPVGSSPASTISRRRFETALEVSKIFKTRRFKRYNKLLNSSDKTEKLYEKEQEKIKQSSNNIDNLLKQIEVKQLKDIKENPSSGISSLVDKKMKDQIEKIWDEIDDYKHDVLEKQNKYWGSE
jgi:hypothetical protein